MNIDWNKIQNDCPKGYEKFITYLIDNKLSTLFEFNNFRLHPEKICYCDLEKFFDDNGLIITIGIYIDELEFDYYINNDSYGEIYKTRQEAKEQGVYKAFEILEGQLNEKL